MLFSGYIDINECQENEDICEHGCSNTIGGYRCKCPRGFQIDDNNKCVGKRKHLFMFYEISLKTNKTFHHIIKNNLHPHTLHKCFYTFFVFNVPKSIKKNNSKFYLKLNFRFVFLKFT